MKPHITKHHGIWVCRMRTRILIDGLMFRPLAYEHPQIGHGYTASEAYEDWRLQMQAQRA